MKDKSLFQLQGDEYFCPTCEKIVRTAYQLQQTDEFHIDKINQEDIEFEEAVSELTPLLSLLESGFYCLWDTKLYPTDGNGRLFWDYPNDNNEMPGSCVLYFGDGDWGTNVPHFMIATQPKKLLNMERVKYYQSKPNCRAIAYYMDGNLTALIDGHHKAMAAAMEHRQCNSIVISRCYHGYRNVDNGKKRNYLSSLDSYFFEDELPDEYTKRKYHIENQIKEPSPVNTIEINTDDDFPCNIDSKFLADFYPSIKNVVGADIFGTIKDEYVQDYLNGKANISCKDYCFFLNSLTVNNDERLFKIIDYTLYHNDQADYIMPSLEHLFEFPHTEELENYLVSYMAKIESEHREIGLYIAQNLW